MRIALGALSDVAIALRALLEARELGPCLVAGVLTKLHVGVGLELFFGRCFHRPQGCYRQVITDRSGALTLGRILGAQVAAASFAPQQRQPDLIEALLGIHIGERIGRDRRGERVVELLGFLLGVRAILLGRLDRLEALQDVLVAIVLRL